MRKLNLTFLTVAVTLLCGCYVTSLHPLFRDNDLIVEPKLIGVWTEGAKPAGETWTVEKASGKGYHITLDDDKYSSLLTAHLAKIGTNLFLDFRISKDGMAEIREMEGPYLGFLMPSHVFARVYQVEPELEVAVLDVGKLQGFLQKNPTALRHEILENDQIVLTASTKELQDFLVKTANDAELFSPRRKFKKSPESPGNSKKL